MNRLSKTLLAPLPLLLLLAGCAHLPFQPHAEKIEGFTLASPDPLKRVAGTLDYAYRIRKSLPLLSGAPSGWTLPPDVDLDLYSASMSVGPNNALLRILVERSDAEPIRVWVDEDLDGSFEGEKVETWRTAMRPTLILRRDAVLPNFQAPDGKPARLRLLISADSGEFEGGKPTFKVECFASWRGEADLGGERVPMAIFPLEPTLEMMSDSARMVVDLNGDGALDPATDSLEHSGLNEPLPFGDGGWRLAKMDLARGEALFDPAEDEQASPRPMLGIGDPVPWFTARTAMGDSFALEGWKGEFIVIQFWSARSPYHEQDVQMLRKVAEEFTPRGVKFVRINVDGANFNNPVGGPVPWVEIPVTGGVQDPLAQLFRVYELPWTLLIDRSGLILSKNLPWNALQRELDKISGPAPLEFEVDIWSRILKARDNVLQDYRDQTQTVDAAPEPGGAGPEDRIEAKSQAKPVGVARAGTKPEAAKKPEVAALSDEMAKEAEQFRKALAESKGGDSGDSGIDPRAKSAARPAEAIAANAKRAPAAKPAKPAKATASAPRSRTMDAILANHPEPRPQKPTPAKPADTPRAVSPFPATRELGLDRPVNVFEAPIPAVVMQPGAARYSTE